MKKLIIVLTVSGACYAQQLDTICYTRAEHQKISDSLQIGLRAYHSIPMWSAQLAQKDATIEMQTRTLINLRHEINSKPAPKRGWWAIGGYGVGLLTGLILML
jgi:hypothetical protein